jgi:hypothetical protein
VEKFNRMKERNDSAPEYMQNIWTEGKGETMPMKKETISVTDVMVMETAASLNVCAIRSGTGSIIFVLRHAASMTKVSSIPIPVVKISAQLWLGMCGTRLWKVSRLSGKGVALSSG